MELQPVQPTVPAGFLQVSLEGLGQRQKLTHQGSHSVSEGAVGHEEIAHPLSFAPAQDHSHLAQAGQVPRNKRLRLSRITPHAYR